MSWNFESIKINFYDKKNSENHLSGNRYLPYKIDIYLLFDLLPFLSHFLSSIPLMKWIAANEDKHYPIDSTIAIFWRFIFDASFILWCRGLNSNNSFSGLCPRALCSLMRQLVLLNTYLYSMNYILLNVPLRTCTT